MGNSAKLIDSVQIVHLQFSTSAVVHFDATLVFLINLLIGNSTRGHNLMVLNDSPTFKLYVLMNNSYFQILAIVHFGMSPLIYVEFFASEVHYYSSI